MEHTIEILRDDQEINLCDPRYVKEKLSLTPPHGTITFKEIGPRVFLQTACSFTSEDNPDVGMFLKQHKSTTQQTCSVTDASSEYDDLSTCLGLASELCCDTRGTLKLIWTPVTADDQASIHRPWRKRKMVWQASGTNMDITLLTQMIGAVNVCAFDACDV